LVVGSGGGRCGVGRKPDRVSRLGVEARESAEARDHHHAVLRRIPQLIEVVEWVETIKEKLNKSSRISCCGKSNLGMLNELLSKLEGKKDE